MQLASNCLPTSKTPIISTMLAMPRTFLLARFEALPRIVLRDGSAAGGNCKVENGKCADAIAGAVHAGHQKELRWHCRFEQCLYRSDAVRGDGARRTERRRQIDPDQGLDRRLPQRCRRDVVSGR